MEIYMSTQVKICGITSMEDVKIVNRFKPDYMGCVLYYPKSKRNIPLDLAAELLVKIDGSVKKVAVVVSPTWQQIRDIEQLGFDYIQIHGKWDKDMISNSTIPIIWAMNMKEEQFDKDNRSKLDKKFYINLNAIIQSDRIYGVLFDSGTPGSGEIFLWNDICKARELAAQKGKKVFLAGGLKAENVAGAIHVLAPDVVDVSSGVEYENCPNRVGKDEKKVEDFIKTVQMEEKHEQGK